MHTQRDHATLWDPRLVTLPPAHRPGHRRPRPAHPGDPPAQSEGWGGRCRHRDGPTHQALANLRARGRLHLAPTRSAAIRVVGRAPRLQHLRPSRWLSGTLAVLAAAWLAVLIVPARPGRCWSCPCWSAAACSPKATSAGDRRPRPRPWRSWTAPSLVAAGAAGGPAGDRHGHLRAGRAGVTLASTDRLRARQQTLIWSQTAIGWADFLAALLAARRTGRGRVG